MATPFNDNIEPKFPKPIDNRQGKFAGGVARPYTSVAEALTAVTTYRYEGLQVLIRRSTNKLDIYWFEGGIADINLVLYKQDVALSDYYTKTEINLLFANLPGRGLEYDPDNKLTLDLDTATLVTPVITPAWTLFKNDGVTPYVPPTSAGKNISVDKGVKANLTATYKYTAPTTGQTIPTAVSGNFGTVLPAAGVNSTPLVVTAISTNTTYTVNFSKPKSGLIVVSNQVQFPSGNDTTSDSISISFFSKSYIGYSSSLVLTGADILTLANGIFSANKNRTVGNITATTGQYTYIVYDSSFGDLTNVIMDGAAPVLGAFTKLTNVTMTNDAGFTVTMIVYRSNVTQAFTNNSLTLS